MAALPAFLIGCRPTDDAAASGPAKVLFSQRLPDLTGQVHAFDQWRGEPLVVNFWATWCAPCVREMPDLDALQNEFPSVRIIGVGVDRPEKIAEFLQKVPVSYLILEARASGLDLMQQLGNTAGGLPFTLVITPQQRIARSIEGQINFDELRSLLKTIVA